jgi:hypothetical protein
MSCQIPESCDAFASLAEGHSLAPLIAGRGGKRQSQIVNPFEGARAGHGRAAHQHGDDDVHENSDLFDGSIKILKSVRGLLAAQVEESGDDLRVVRQKLTAREAIKRSLQFGAYETF